MIKRLIETLRRADGYAGMAIHHGDVTLFSEGMEPAFAGRMASLFREAQAHFPTSKISLVIRGYTVTIFEIDDMLVTSRFEGRFTTLPALPEEESEYTTGQVTSSLRARAEARKEAEAMLRALMNKG